MTTFGDMSPRRSGARVLGAGMFAVASLAGCSSGVSRTSPPPTTALAVPTSGCPPTLVPSGFVADATHSGPIQPGQYSPSGDVQAAMIYDHYQAGYRSVYTHAQPQLAGDQDLVVECTTLQFATVADSTRFVAAYKALRAQAGALATEVTPPARFGSATVAYTESQQSFAGYGIASTNVAEMAVVAGPRFYVVAVAGPTPSSALASALIAGMVRG